MSVIESNALIRTKDSDGNTNLLYPITKVDNVDGLQDALDSKADVSHGTHVTFSETAPVVAGTADVGSATTVSRSDHIHPAQTSVSGNAGTASKWETARNINGMSIQGDANRTNYGVCDTAPEVQEKVVDCPGFELVTGAEITVRFTVDNIISDNLILNVNNTGARPIVYRGSATGVGDYLKANRVYTFRCINPYWYLVGDVNTDVITQTILGQNRTPTFSLISGSVSNDGVCAVLNESSNELTLSPTLIYLGKYTSVKIDLQNSNFGYVLKFWKVKYSAFDLEGSPITTSSLACTDGALYYGGECRTHSNTVWTHMSINFLKVDKSSFTDADKEELLNALSIEIIPSSTTFPLLLATPGYGMSSEQKAYFDYPVGLIPSSNTITANISGNAATATRLESRNQSVTTSGTGSAYTATVSGITILSAGMSFTMIPHVESTSTSPTLDVNGLGAKLIRRRVSISTTMTTGGVSEDWLAANKPVTVTYDGSFWIADLPKASATDLMGTVPIENGGTGANNATTALTNLGVPTYVNELVNTLTLESDGEFIYLKFGDTILGQVAASSGESTVKCTGLTVAEDSLTLDVADTSAHTLTAEITPIDCDQTLRWTSGNTSVVQIDSTGALTIVGEGTATIIARCGSYSDTITVSVVDPTIKSVHYREQRAINQSASEYTVYWQNDRAYSYYGDTETTLIPITAGRTYRIYVKSLDGILDTDIIQMNVMQFSGTSRLSTSGWLPIKSTGSTVLGSYTFIASDTADGVTWNVTIKDESGTGYDTANYVSWLAENLLIKEVL